MGRFSWAPAAYRQLNGILCVYKPAELQTAKLQAIIQGNLTRDLNALPCYKVEAKMRRIDSNTDVQTPLVLDSSPLVTDDMLEHRLVLGQRYIPSDVRIRPLHPLRRHSSGVLLLGLGRGIGDLQFVAMSRFLRVYHVKGRFGWATNNFSPKGKIIERTSFGHISEEKLDKLCASVQSSHLRNMFQYAGVDPHSQKAYELAATGLVRPVDGKTPPMLYSVKCVEFQPPDFTLEIHSINEHCDYFKELIHDIGLQMKSAAVCTAIRRLRYGHFDLSRALLRKHWTLEHIIDNLRHNRSLLTPEKLSADLLMQDCERL
ncbi:hypothetical protein BaRGS_00039450, partial [Batillaria attramentaria]